MRGFIDRGNASAFLPENDDPFVKGPMARRPAQLRLSKLRCGLWRWQVRLCGEWNTIAEENAAAIIAPGPGRPPRKGRKFALEPLAGESPEAPRLASALPNSTVSLAAVLYVARCCWSAAIPASANRRC